MWKSNIFRKNKNSLNSLKEVEKKQTEIIKVQEDQINKQNEVIKAQEDVLIGKDKIIQGYKDIMENYSF